MAVKRIYVEKKAAYAVEAKKLLAEVGTVLGIAGITGIRVLSRYDVEGVDQALFDQCRRIVFSEPQVDLTWDELPVSAGETAFAVEFLPGQFDQRADSCAQCIQIVSGGKRPAVRTAKVYLVAGEMTDDKLSVLKRHLMNPVESREARMETYETLREDYPEPAPVETVAGFTGMDEGALARFLSEWSLAMDLDDLRFCRDYFKAEGRDPTVTELRVLDTYWSDHCRHTTFLTHIDEVEILPEPVKAAYGRYLSLRNRLYGEQTDRPVTLMDLATIGQKALKADGKLETLDQSEEVNACSVKIKATVNGKEEDWLLMFKNETHNHPTEVEPFGGAATCLGGGIRDPLSGRAYVYQAMRLTGAGDPRVPEHKTLEGKLSQRTICTTAAQGYSAYGNQVGVATGLVDEIYHPGYVAKRMELGALVAAAPAKHVVRGTPEPGDVVLLIGGRTGRDGCGGATGSSKSHTKESLESCGAEVQKGNPPEERKILRLFRNPDASTLIKRCNDFGAGGVSVAIGELADGLSINLDLVRKKYDGLDGTELAISESQERMAVVIAAQDEARFIELADAENLEAYRVAEVTETPRMVIRWRGQTVVDVSREFLNSNGVPKHAAVTVAAPEAQGERFVRPLRDRLDAMVSSLAFCSRKGLSDRFDATIGGATVAMPFGGVYQKTPIQAMAAKLPVLRGECGTASLMAWGYDPEISSADPFLGSMTAVISSVGKVLAMGGSRERLWLSFQEYFERLAGDPVRWGKPFAALLGALTAQLELGLAAIGGKDSMSGSFEDLNVPPTLVSFAVSTAEAASVVTPEFKAAGHRVVLLAPGTTPDGLPNFAEVRQVFDTVERLIGEGKALAVWSVEAGGAAEALFKMALGNRIGVRLDDSVKPEELFAAIPGGFVVELVGGEAVGTALGETIPDFRFEVGVTKIPLAPLEETWDGVLEDIYPTRLADETAAEVPALSYTERFGGLPTIKVKRPRVLIPAFPGTNCEEDTARAFEKAGADPSILVVKNLSPEDVRESVRRFAKAISETNIIAIPGGFSGGDEPDGSGKFITAFFRNPEIKEAVMALMNDREGLMIGICNGFQALLKLGLLPYGDIREMDESCATLTVNEIGRHQSMLTNTRIASVKSPWMRYNEVGDIHTVAISHGEGRFVATEELLETLIQNGQIATQYTDLAGTPTMKLPYNPNGSVMAVEAITSPDGRILGKMGHSERIGEMVYKNVPGRYDQRLFEAAVAFCKG